MEAIPPTQEKNNVNLIINILIVCPVLLENTNRALYQASIWAACLQTNGTAERSPDGFGWKRNEILWVPVWTLLLEVVKTSRDLIKCGCKVEPLCSMKFKCHEADLPCTAFCQCSGYCAGVFRKLK